MKRRDIVDEARRWIGTPYVHQASCRGQGADCLGLVRGVWRFFFGDEPEELPAYAPDWCDIEDKDRLLKVGLDHFEKVDVRDAGPGDFLLFRMAGHLPVRHCAIMSASERIIHAYWARQVSETHLAPWWKRRIVACFQFPGLLDP